MTKQEAIKILDKYDLNFCDIDGNPIPPQDLAEAFDMAIQALQQQTCDNCKFNKETDGMNCYECLKGMSDNFEALDQDEIVRCKDCKYWHEWEHGTGSCHRSDIMWVGSDYDDYCSFAEKRGSDGE